MLCLRIFRLFRNIKTKTYNNYEVDIEPKKDIKPLAEQKKYQIKDIQVGKGKYGIVKVVNDKMGRYLALKTLKKKDEKSLDRFEEEKSILFKLKHPNIISYIDSGPDYLVTELCRGGELFYYIKTYAPLKTIASQTIIKQLLNAIAYCHEMGIIHRDIKPENILLKNRNDISTIKLIDFGLSKRNTQPLPRQALKTTTKVGTPYYIAPEIIKAKQAYGIECDLWSIGVCLFIILSGFPPFDGENNCDIMKSVTKGYYDFRHPVFNYVSKDGKELIRGLLEMDPQKRLTAQKALQHPWFSQK